GLGFEVIEERVEGAGIRHGLMAAVILVEEPIPKRDGANWEDEGALERRSLEADEGASVCGGERVALAGDGDERMKGRHRLPHNFIRPWRFWGSRPENPEVVEITRHIFRQSL